MKKIFFVWLLALVSILGYAQNLTEHMSFMGIPINGTITQFQTKLQGKGCALDRITNSQLGVGCRAFTGKFVDNKVNIFVYYDEKTKIVYRVKAVLSGTSEEIAVQQYEKIKGLLLTKYGSTFSNYGTQSDKEAFGVLVAHPADPPGSSWRSHGRLPSDRQKSVFSIYHKKAPWHRLP